VKKIIFTFIILNCSLLIANAKWIQQNLINDTIQLNLVMNKQIYLEGELVWFDFDVIINKSIKLDRGPILDNNYDISLILADSKNNVLRYKKGIPEIMGSIEYPDTMNYFDELTEAFGTFEIIPVPENKKYWPLYLYLPADEYTFSIELRLSINKKEHIFRTNTVNFSVLKPKGNDSDAYNELKSLEVRTFYNNYFEMSVEFQKFYDNFSEKYSGSVYLEKIFNRMEYSIEYSLSPEEGIIYYKNIIINHPDYYANYNSLYSLKHFYGDNKEEFINFLNITSNEKEGTIVSRMCKKMIRIVQSDN
jgi:hypothetical protein